MTRAGVFALLVIALGTLAVGCRDQESARPKSQPSATPVSAQCVPTVLVAKRGTPTLDGELDQPVWHDALATAAFVEERENRPVPHTEARASWDESALYLALYVADDDLRASDRVRIEIDGKGSLDVSPARKLSCRFGAQSDCAALGIQGAFDVDGDVDAPNEEDEEWDVTLAIPWRALAPSGRPAALPVSFQRDDTVEGRQLVTVWSRGCGAIRFE